MKKIAIPTGKSAVLALIKKLKDDIAESQHILSVIEPLANGLDAADRTPAPTIEKAIKGKLDKAPKTLGMIPSETWLAAIGKRPKSANQIFEAVAEKMGWNEAQQKIARGRIYPALENLKKSNQIVAEGAHGSMKYWRS